MSTKSIERQPKVVIAGAGMTGILMAIRLLKAGIKDIVILEKRDKLGGTWRENTYPGVACDVPAHFYTYSFELNPNWSHFFAEGAEIQSYFEHVAEKYQITPLIHFNEAVTDAHFNNHQWHIQSAKNQHYVADFFICATGILHHPAFPQIKGLERFQGKQFHTAQWDHSVNIDANTKVGIIGTGSTAAQCIPKLVETGADVNVFQRTPQWIIPLPDRHISDREKRLLKRHRWLLRLNRWYGRMTMTHFFNKAIAGHKVQQTLLNLGCKLNLKLNVKNKALRKKLTPDYQIGCKRVIVNSTFYPAIQKPNAHLITEGIEEITETGIRTKDGKHHDLDVLVLSTGFQPFNFMRPMNLTGKNGLHIDTAWKDKIDAYRSILLPDFPNFFLMLGPFTPISNFSVIAMSEVQADYVMKLIEKWRRREFESIEPKPQAVKAFIDYIQVGMKDSTWTSGCNSWYLDQSGRPILWPYTWGHYEQYMSNLKMDDLLINTSSTRSN
ncbi:flavin-containing monooxygenase [Alteromonas sp. a30]|uniref:flavin-containing monooxygenase n=1 Tax=Alteromonas sp. a30 TaxID=2730917 RepID=UPI00227F8460|nr:NAD(P)/FAD-dependent oxidoreductase [Alteromonas sp. a30]MCY7295588.1 NAD(P)/FAD-dependent oxidoreductase [Alteromonas sp. a30]